MNLLINTLTWLGALAGVVLVEQTLAGLLRRWQLQREPLVSDPDSASFYQRSLFTPASAEVRRTWLGLIACTALIGYSTTLAALGGWAWVLTLALAVLTLGLTLAWDLSVWECVAVSPWQVAWRRGWRRSVRRLPLEQVAQIHLVQRGLWRGPGRLAFHGNQWLGSAYIALQLHDGRAVKLPRTGRLLGHAAVDRVARELRKRKQRRDRERARAMRAAHYARLSRQQPVAQELALRHELVALRLATRRNQQQAQTRAPTETMQFEPTAPGSRLEFAASLCQPASGPSSAACLPC